MGWMISVAFWPLFCEFKIHVRLVSLSLQGGLFVRRFPWFSDHLGVLVSLMAFILGCEILFYMLTYPLQICTFWVVVPVYLFLPVWSPVGGITFFVPATSQHL